MKSLENKYEIQQARLKTLEATIEARTNLLPDHIIETLLALAKNGVAATTANTNDTVSDDDEDETEEEKLLREKKEEEFTEQRKKEAHEAFMKKFGKLSKDV
eukprot:m.85112 g.85112  ORF g.85112 m.85112 type:complete len:102 (+) comp25832_c0_seq1:924-1229(+)